MKKKKRCNNPLFPPQTHKIFSTQDTFANSKWVALCVLLDHLKNIVILASYYEQRCKTNVVPVEKEIILALAIFNPLSPGGIGTLVRENGKDSRVGGNGGNVNLGGF